MVDDPADVRAVLLDPVAFPPDNALSAHTPISPGAMRTLAGVGFGLPPALANNAGPSHRPIRRLVAGFFSRARVTAAEPRIEALAGSCLAVVGERLDRDGCADLVALLADVAPATVLLELLGLHELGLELSALKRWSRDSLELFWGWPTPDRQEELAASAAEFYSWLRVLDAGARRVGGSDLFGQLAASGLSAREACGAAYFVLVAGHETTSQLIATALLRLIGPPLRWRTVGTDRAHAQTAVEEVLRSESSVPTWRRTARSATSIGEVTIPGGAPLLLGLSGNGGSPDLAFGLGSHRCLGAELARLETRVVLSTASAMLPHLDLVERQPPMLDLLSFRAPRRVLVSRG